MPKGQQYIQLNSKAGFDLIEPEHIAELCDSLRKFDGVFYDIINELNNMKSESEDALFLRGRNPLHNKISQLEAYYRNFVIKTTDSFNKDILAGLINDARIERRRILEIQRGEVEYVKNNAIIDKAKYTDVDEVFVRKQEQIIKLCNRDLEIINGLMNSDNNAY